jgi:hypothetical protein
VRKFATLSKQTVRFAIQWYNMAIRPSISQELATAFEVPWKTAKCGPCLEHLLVDAAALDVDELRVVAAQVEFESRS